jgi:peptidyl-prolyl cis-trans isomerase B (cyclophilin B)
MPLFLSLLRVLKLSTRTFSFVCAASLALGLGGAAQAASSNSTQGNPIMSTTPRVKLQTNMGDMIIELNAEKAPKTVENFLSYVKEGFYDNTVFHRIINNFMIQGGGFDVGMKQKSTHATIENEADNGLKNNRYTLAMARTGDPHSATAQFFINVADNEFLNFTSPTPNGWGYAVFGKVVEGMDVVDKIKEVKTGNKGFHQDVPLEDVILEKASIIE